MTLSAIANSMNLTPSQKEAFQTLSSGADVFLTGKAGSGKSYVTNLYIQACRDAGLQVVVMAPTGTAALNLSGGTTIHRVLGIHSSEVFKPKARIKSGNRVLEAADVVVVDEVSMCRVDLFDHFWAMVEMARKKGGAGQVVVVGDFHQIPPVCTGDERPLLKQYYPNAASIFPFEGHGWKSAHFKLCQLNEVVRQPDPEFVRNLNLARVGDDHCVPYFNRRAVGGWGEVPDGVIRIVAKNETADAINKKYADALVDKGYKERVYTASVDKGVAESDMRVPRENRMVVGARVMLCANLLDQNLGNGSMGVVTELHSNAVSVRFDGKSVPERIEQKAWEVKQVVAIGRKDGDEKNADRLTSEKVGSYKQIPLKLAYAITIHKSQGKSFDACAVDSRAFEPGMLYVALSRCKSYDGLYVYPKIDPSRLNASKRVIAMEKEMLAASVSETSQFSVAEHGVQGRLSFDGGSSVSDLESEERSSKILSALPKLVGEPLLAPEDDDSCEKIDGCEACKSVASFPEEEFSGAGEQEAAIDTASGNDLVSIRVPSRFSDIVQGYICALLESERERAGGSI